MYLHFEWSKNLQCISFHTKSQVHVAISTFSKLQTFSSSSGFVTGSDIHFLVSRRDAASTLFWHSLYSTSKELPPAIVATHLKHGHKCQQNKIHTKESTKQYKIN